MEQKQLSKLEISQICRELAVLLHAGVMLGDGLALLAQEEEGETGRVLAQIGTAVDQGETLTDALKQSGRFPAYVVGMVEVGECSGRTEQALQSLARYYERQEQMDRQIRSALTYPAILLLLMLVVIVVLLSQVLPVFDEVYASLGGQLTGVAGGLLLAGQALDAAMPVLCVLMAAAVALVLAFSLSGSFRNRLLAMWRRRFGDRGVSRAISEARFAQALSMGLGSGLPLEEAVDQCAALLEDVPSAAKRCRTCAGRLREGGDLADSLRESGVLPAAACRMLTLGLRSGNGDEVMEDIARRLSDDADQALERRVAQVEPTLVLATSLLVGAILLAVMLPLMNIMTAIG